MSEMHRADGQAAFESGMRRSNNPHDVTSEEWLDWMDGYDHAWSRADHPRHASPLQPRPERVS